jgi:hypothetical protein
MRVMVNHQQRRNHQMNKALHQERKNLPKKMIQRVRQNNQQHQLKKKKNNKSKKRQQLLVQAMVIESQHHL